MALTKYPQSTLLYHYVVALQIFINLQKISYNKSLDGEGILGGCAQKIGFRVASFGNLEIGKKRLLFTPSTF